MEPRTLPIQKWNLPQNSTSHLQTGRGAHCASARYFLVFSDFFLWNRKNRRCRCDFVPKSPDGQWPPLPPYSRTPRRGRFLSQMSYSSSQPSKPGRGAHCASGGFAPSKPHRPRRYRNGYFPSGNPKTFRFSADGQWPPLPPHSRIPRRGRVARPKSPGLPPGFGASKAPPPTQKRSLPNVRSY